MTVKLWNPRKSRGTELIRTMTGHTNAVTSVAFSHNINNTLLVSSSEDKTVKVWNPSNGDLIKTFSHNDKVLCIAFSPYNNMLGSGSVDSTIKLLNINNIEEINDDF